MQFFGNAGGVLWNLSWKDPSDLKKIMIKITSKIKKKDRKGVPTNFSENLKCAMRYRRIFSSL